MLEFQDSAFTLPREKLFREGSANLSTKELIALILGRGNSKKDVFTLAAELEKFLALRASVPDIQELLEIDGLGPAKASQIMACLELSGRFLLGIRAARADTPESILPHLAFLKYRNQESFVAATFNASNNLLGIHTLTTGLADSTQVHPREAFAHAIGDRAVAVVFAHNHPSGSSKPSPEDMDVTRRLCRSGKILEIPVLDHIIITRTGYCSLKRDFPLLFAPES
ncbi:MAG: DNA repair protein RadC [Fibrobacteraceae bacterium]|jgi:DNA repair protein RadC